MRIVFFGTPEFAAISLEHLHKNGIEIGAVVTVADKPSGRGQKLHTSAVKDYAVANQLTVLQPEKLKDEAFQLALDAIAADLFVVVAFRMCQNLFGRNHDWAPSTCTDRFCPITEVQRRFIGRL